MPAHTGAFLIRDAVLKLGGTTFTNQVWRARLVPDTPIQQQRTLVPDGTISDVDSAMWTLELAGVQDYETGGLAAYLQTNAGNQVAFVIAPKSGAGKKQASGTVIAINPDFGGEQGEFASFEIELPVVGAPTFAAQA
jgi:hypothetical protein